jgi:hypothetical protein
MGIHCKGDIRFDRNRTQFAYAKLAIGKKSAVADVDRKRPQPVNHRDNA